MKFDTYLDRFHSAITGRKVLTNVEIKCAARDGVKPETLARTNDDLSAELTAALDAESDATGNRYGM
jgi:hypothetical protein